MHAALLVLALVGASEPVRLADGWQYRWGESPLDASGRLEWLDPGDAGWAPLKMPGYPPRGDSRAFRVWLRVPLPQLPWRDPVLKIDAVPGGNFELYLGDRKLYEFPEGGVNTRRVAGIPWHLVSLPPEAAGQTLTMRSH